MKLGTIWQNIVTIATRDITLSEFDKWLEEGWFGVKSRAGVNVNHDTALSISAVFACVRNIAEDCAKLPLFLYQKTGDRSRRKAGDHPYYRLFHDWPNPEMTAQEYRETCTGHIALRGNSYSQIIRNRRGDVAQLWPLNPARMDMKRNDAGAIVYEYREQNGTPRIFTAADILHLRGFSPDGLAGYSPIKVHADTLGLAKSQSNYAGEFYDHNATPDIAYKHPAKLNPEAFQRLKDSLDKRKENRQGSVILEEGMSIEKVGMSHEDSQFIESREFSVEEICQIFRMPPHKVAHMKQATFSNIEQQAIEYVVDCLQPWLNRWEQRLNMQILGPDMMEQGYYFEHQINGLLRGDFKSRMEGYNIGRNIGMMSANDIRELENMDEITGGDIYLVPANMIPADMAEGFWKTKSASDAKGGQYAP